MKVSLRSVRAAWLKPELLQACFATVPQLDRISRATARWPQRRHAGRTVLHRNPQFYEAMQANVLLARDCKQAWCAKLFRCMKPIGYLVGLGEEARVIEELDVSRPPDLSKAVQRLLHWTAARIARELAVTA